MKTIITADWSVELGSEFAVKEQDVARFHEDGVVHLHQVLSPELLNHYGTEIDKLSAKKNCNAEVPLDDRDTFGKAFIQVGQLWESSAVIRELVKSRRLAKLAADLMGTTGVRLWQDQSLFKEPGGGLTPWHADSHYFPVANDNIVTLWIPLQPVPLEMGPLMFAAGSHRCELGRDLDISDVSEKQIGESVADKGFKVVNEPFDLGDISFHRGWTMHRAGPNVTDRVRRVFTIVYMDEHMRLAEPANSAQACERDRIAPGIRVGDVIDTEKSPVVYSRSK